MVIRYYLRCVHCRKVTQFRIGVAIPEHQPFRFSCQGCGTKISGALNANYETITATLDVKNAKQLTALPRKIHFYEMSYLDLPIPAALKAPDAPFSPFLAQLEEMGLDELQEFQHESARFDEFRRASWDTLERLYGFRKRNQWASIRREVKRIPPHDKRDCSEPIDLDVRLYHARAMFFMPVLKRDRHIKALNDTSRRIKALKEANPAAFRAFGDAIIPPGNLDRLKVAIFQIDAAFVEGFDRFRPIIVLNYYRDQSPEHLNTFHVTELDFQADKTFFIDAHETLSKCLRVLAGLTNVELRGDHNLFDPAIVRKVTTRKVSSLSDFDQLPNAKKAELTAQESEWHQLATPYLDASLRNGVGHADIELDLGTQTLRYSVRGVPREIRYIVFMKRSYELFLALYDVSYLLQMFHEAYLDHGGESAQGTSPR